MSTENRGTGIYIYLRELVTLRKATCPTQIASTVVTTIVLSSRDFFPNPQLLSIASMAPPEEGEDYQQRKERNPQRKMSWRSLYDVLPSVNGIGSFRNLTKGTDR